MQRTISMSVAVLSSLLALLVAACHSDVPAAVTPTSPEAPGPIVVKLAPGSSLDSGLRLRVSVAGGALTDVLLDTGSTGIVIAQRFLGTSYTPTGQLFSNFTYSSSGNSYSGEWVTTKVHVHTADSGAEVVETVPLRVRMATRSCAPRSGCTSDPNSIDVAMMGIGFDRVDPDGTTVDPQINPLLNLAANRSVGSTRRGYVLTPSQITLGITDQTITQFSVVALTRLPSGQGDDWQAPRACVSVPTATIGPLCGELLVDTGLQYSIIQAPAGANPPQHPGDARTAGRMLLDDGQQVVVTSPDLQSRAIYDFTVGDPATGAPSAVAWGHDTAAHDGGPFVNTGLHALSHFDYAYDADLGRVGFREHS